MPLRTAKPVGRVEVALKLRNDYSEVSEILNKHGSLFMSGLNSKEAYYAKKRLSVLCKCKLDAHPAVLKDGSESGYYFEKS